MADKLLSQECVDYCNLTKILSEIEDRLNDKIFEIVETYNNYANSIELSSLIVDNKTLKVIYNYSNCVDEGHDKFVMPIEWLDLDKAEIKELVLTRKKEEMERLKEMTRIAEAKRKKETEMKERAEYERLKAKFEKEKNNG